jgi:hypothetical protein
MRSAIIIGILGLFMTGSISYGGENQDIFNTYHESQCDKFPVLKLGDLCRKAGSFPDLQKKIASWKTKCLESTADRPKSQTINGYIIKSDGTDSICYSAAAYAQANIKAFFDGSKSCESDD